MNDDKKIPFDKCATGTKRQELAERFTQYLNTIDTENHAFPVNLNGAWGTGKTFFVDNWKLLVEVAKSYRHQNRCLGIRLS